MRASSLILVVVSSGRVNTRAGNCELGYVSCLGVFAYVPVCIFVCDGVCVLCVRALYFQLLPSAVHVGDANGGIHVATTAHRPCCSQHTLANVPACRDWAGWGVARTRRRVLYVAFRSSTSRWEIGKFECD